MPGGVFLQPNASDAVLCSLRWESNLPCFRRKEHLINESLSYRRGGAGCSLISGAIPCHFVRSPVTVGLLVWGCVDHGPQQPVRVRGGSRSG